MLAVKYLFVYCAVRYLKFGLTVCERLDQDTDTLLLQSDGPPDLIKGIGRLEFKELGDKSALPAGWIWKPQDKHLGMEPVRDSPSTNAPNRKAKNNASKCTKKQQGLRISREQEAGTGLSQLETSRR